MTMALPMELTLVAALLLTHVFAVTFAAFEATRIIVIAMPIGALRKASVSNTKPKRYYGVDRNPAASMGIEAVTAIPTMTVSC